MTISVKIQPSPVRGGDPFTVTLTSSRPNLSCMMKVLVDGAERDFATFPGQPKAKTQRVWVFGNKTDVGIEPGWGTNADHDKELKVQADGASDSKKIA